GATPYAVLEVDEHYLRQVLNATRPRVVALLNLSRDQLDRANEVAMMAALWRNVLLEAAPGATTSGAGHPHTGLPDTGLPDTALPDTGLPDTGLHVVANADDPMVTWAASAAKEVTWVGAGQRWHDDSWVCPECGSHIERSGDDWWCVTGDLRRPE